MDALVMDLTHGGVKIAISLSKKKIFNKIYCYDIYNTLSKINREILNIFEIEIIELKELKNFENDLIVISPIHLPLKKEEIMENNRDINYKFITHHDAIAIILDNWSIRCKNIPKIEITGVKGKTSSVFMLKEIFKNPLILSSLGSILVTDKQEMILKRNISITPANIKETIDLAYKIANPICEIAKGNHEKTYEVNYESSIFENSLGGCGIGDVGLLTNIVENYSIAGGNSTAAIAKKQIFKCPIVVCEKESFDKYYYNEDSRKVNTFSIDNEKANLTISKLNLNLIKTTIIIKYDNLITVNGDIIKGSIEIETFAPHYHHVSNVLGVVGVSLSFGINEDDIKNSLKNYKGIKGRTSIKKVENSTIIEEINPGINSKAIEKSIEMIKNLDNYCVILGGDYGITCEELNEEEIAKILKNQNIELILTGQVGFGILNKMDEKIEYYDEYRDALRNNIKNKKNILFIYRSKYKNITKR